MNKAQFNKLVGKSKKLYIEKTGTDEVLVSTGTWLVTGNVAKGVIGVHVLATLLPDGYSRYVKDGRTWKLFTSQSGPDIRRVLTKSASQDGEPVEDTKLIYYSEGLGVDVTVLRCGDGWVFAQRAMWEWLCEAYGRSVTYAGIGNPLVWRDRGGNAQALLMPAHIEVSAPVFRYLKSESVG